MNITNLSREREIYIRAITLFRENGLEGWNFKLDRAIRRAGNCHFGRKCITLSRHMVETESITMEQIDNILLHEVAHAIVGYQHGHDDVWRNKAMELGCDGARCHTLRFTPAPRYRVTCSCGACNFTRMRFKAKTWNTKVCMHCRSPLAVALL
jgi:predicted SprT family Zn-dependent metalloprotease